MGWKSHPTSEILTTIDANEADLNLFYNYGQMSASDITTTKKSMLMKIQGRLKTLINFIIA